MAAYHSLVQLIYLISELITINYYLRSDAQNAR